MSRSFKHNPIRKWTCRREMRSRILRAMLREDAIGMDATIDDGFSRKMLDCWAETFGWESWNETLRLERAWNPDFTDEDELELRIKWLKDVMGK